MSFEIEIKPGSKVIEGKMTVKSELEVSPELYVARMKALIEVAQRKDEYSSNTSTFHILEILNEMLPTPEQAKKMFTSPH